MSVLIWSVLHLRRNALQRCLEKMGQRPTIQISCLVSKSPYITPKTPQNQIPLSPISPDLILGDICLTLISCQDPDPPTSVSKVQTDLLDDQKECTFRTPGVNRWFVVA